MPFLPWIPFSSLLWQDVEKPEHKLMEWKGDMMSHLHKQDNMFAFQFWNAKGSRFATLLLI